jgi:hypothetical protein
VISPVLWNPGFSRRPSPESKPAGLFLAGLGRNSRRVGRNRICRDLRIARTRAVQLDAMQLDAVQLDAVQLD